MLERRHEDGGLTLVELVIAMCLFAIALTMAMAISSNQTRVSQKHSRMEKLQYSATRDGQVLADDLHSMRPPILISPTSVGREEARQRMIFDSKGPVADAEFANRPLSGTDDLLVASANLIVMWTEVDTSMGARIPECVGHRIVSISPNVSYYSRRVVSIPIQTADGVAETRRCIALQSSPEALAGAQDERGHQVTPSSKFRFVVMGALPSCELVASRSMISVPIVTRRVIQVGFDVYPIGKYYRSSIDAKSQAHREVAILTRGAEYRFQAGCSEA